MRRDSLSDEVPGNSGILAGLLAVVSACAAGNTSTGGGTAQGTAPQPPRRIRATGDWSVLVPGDFEIIDNGDSVQAHKEGRIVYVGSLMVRDRRGEKIPAETSCATLAGKMMASTPAHQRLSFAEGARRGEAHVGPREGRWQLKGVVCAAGTVATCVIDFPHQRDQAWAIATWKSLEHP